MIKLMNNQNTWESPVFTHSDPGGTQYTLTHNFGKQPDVIKAYKLVGEQWVDVIDFDSWYGEGAWQYNGMNVSRTGNTANTTYVTVYTTGIAGTSIKFKCFNLGTTQTITNITPAFQWSTSEQVWPSEKDSSGRILYCKEIAFGAMPNNGTKTKAHNIPGLVGNKIRNSDIL